MKSFEDDTFRRITDISAAGVRVPGGERPGGLDQRVGAHLRLVGGAQGHREELRAQLELQLKHDAERHPHLNAV